ncbi:hypothetical protein ISO55_00145 [Morganella morganii subsp. morganii]|uniref:hypothetical protein n=1 Tax=Morganella morganii TaxID=582 RepID=UPI001BDADBA3|nr:hypothetical protein [Morganella morganii]MBT0365386.1 hypothetical protein [Morganella morganii subsp. morganii]
MASGLEKYLNDLEKRLNATGVRVGFFEDATYTDGTSVAMVAYVNEYGATINQQARTVTTYRSMKKDGSFARGGRFVKAKSSNFATSHDIPAHTVNIPPRPFFRNAINKHKEEWVDAISEGIANGGDAKSVLEAVGGVIQGDVQTSISELAEPELSAATLAARRSRGNGNTNPLTDTRTMITSVNYEVTDD